MQALRDRRAGWRDIENRCGALAVETEDLLRALPLSVSPPADEVAAVLAGADVLTETVTLPDGGQVPVVYVDSLITRQHVWNQVLRPLASGALDVDRLPGVQHPENMNQLLHLLLSNHVAVLPPGGRPAALQLAGVPQRQVNQPTTERTIVGPKEAFVENLDVDLGLVRNRLRDPRLRVEFHVAGRRSRTRIALLYIDGVSSASMVQRTREGLRQIGVDHIRTSMDVAELIWGHTLTPFPLVEQTERPDRVANGLVEGRICCLVEGNPFALVVPVNFFEFQKDGEGSLQGPLTTAFVRNLRILGMFVTVMIPGLYTALLTSDVGVLPTTLAVTVASGRAPVPYPVLTETLLMLVIIDVLAEAISQSASGLGGTLGVVGSLIVGQMMVQAQLASSLMMIVIASTMMGSFLSLKWTFSYALRLWKYPVVLLSGFAGLEGWFTGLMLIVVHLVSLKSAGVPYFSPLAPVSAYDLAHYGPMQPSRGQLRRRPAMWNPLQPVRSRRGGRT